MNQEEFLRMLRDLSIKMPEQYRVGVSRLFRDFVQREIESRIHSNLVREQYAQGLVFRHRGDLVLQVEGKTRLYVETKVIARPERVAPDHDKRMYQMALASFDLKMKYCQDRWVQCKTKEPFVVFALAIPIETHHANIQRVETKMSALLQHYLNACCLYIFDLKNLKRADHLLSEKPITFDAFLETLQKLLT